jgi:tetratricopeptide (TPR) repeat protein
VKGLIFRKSVRLLPGLKINLSKTGASLTVGPRGAHVTVGRGRPKLSLDLPGTGIYFRRTLGTSETEKKKEAQKQQDTKTEGKDRKTATDDQKQQEPGDSQKSVLNLGVLDRLLTPPDELELAEGLRELEQGNDDAAYAHFRKATSLPDGAFLAGFLALRRGDFNQAIADLNTALAEKDRLGTIFAKYGVDAAVELPIMEDIVAEIRPDVRGVLFALSEAYQHVGMLQQAIECLRQIHAADPEDLMIRLALAELYSEAYPDDKQAQQEIVKLAEGVHNESLVHATLLFYRARALRKLGLFEAARETLNEALRRKKDYPEDLLLALRYERALLYEATGQKQRAQAELEKIYAEAPTFEDVAVRLGLEPIPRPNTLPQ